MRWSRSLIVSSTLVVAGLVFVACGNSSPADQTQADGPTAEAGGVSDDGTSTVTSAQTNGSLSFAADVQPVLEQNCVSCHSNNGPGTTHLEMATAGDVASIAEFIAFRVDEREMPPWPISPLTEVAFEYDLSMSDADRQIIVDWAADGAALDVDATTTLTPTNQTYAPIDADVVLTAAEPYPGSDALDDYRCRVYDPEFTENTWVTGIDVRPDETRVLHHGVLFIASAAQRPAADAQDGSDGRPGWTCQTIPRLGGGDLAPAGGWAPGSNPMVAPTGSGWLMQPGDFLIMQWHYHYDGEPLPDNSGIGVQFASNEDLAAFDGALRRINTATILGPVEIPCATYESGPLCDRNAAVARIAQEFGFESSFISNVVNDRCGVTPEDFSHMVDGTASSSCEINAPVGEVVSIRPHMHELGSTYRMTLNPGEPDERVLVDIDRWNFDWQMSYDPAEPLVFESGDRLQVECGWDRALWPAGLEARYVVFAEGTQDEMCYTSIAMLR